MDPADDTVDDEDGVPQAGADDDDDDDDDDERVSPVGYDRPRGVDVGRLRKLEVSSGAARSACAAASRHVDGSRSGVNRGGFRLLPHGGGVVDEGASSGVRDEGDGRRGAAGSCARCTCGAVVPWARQCSQRITDAAVATFRLSSAPVPGIATVRSAFAASSFERPSASLPKSNSTRAGRGVAARPTSVCDEVATTVKPTARRVSARPAPSGATTKSRNSAPPSAVRIAAGDRPAVSPAAITARTPKCAHTRRMAPTLCGFFTSSSRTTVAAPRSRFAHANRSGAGSVFFSRAITQTPS